jgi:hypothetical protein
MRTPLLALVLLALLGCEGSTTPAVPDAGGQPDAGASDAGHDAGSDAGAPDAGALDAGPPDGGTLDGGTLDGGVPDAGPATKSAKRGLAYDLASPADLAAVSSGVSWYYNWGTKPNAAVPADYHARYELDYYPMLWNGNFNSSEVIAFLAAHPEVKHLLVMNEPNLTSQANLTPAAAAAIWPKYEQVATAAGVKLVGPQITWGTLAGYGDPVVWLDAFYAAYQSANGGRAPRIDALGFHWYDYGLNGQLDRLTKYGKPFWVTEFANWHTSSDGAQIDSLSKQETQMTAMVSVCESRADVERYAWFTGRISPDPHFDSLLGADGKLTTLGALYLSLPH